MKTGLARVDDPEPASVTLAPVRTSRSAPASAAAPLSASTMRAASPVVGSPPRVRPTSVAAYRSVAPFARNTIVASPADSVCSHTPSASLSPAATVYAKVSVRVPEPET